MYDPYTVCVNTMFDVLLVTFTDKDLQLSFESHLHVYTSAQIRLEALLFHLGLRKNYDMIIK